MGHDISCIIWLDANVNTNERRNAEQKLASIVKHFEKFQDKEQCQKYIEERLGKDRLIIIVSGRLGKEIVPSVHNLQQVISIYVYCMDKKSNEQWACSFTKVKAVVVQLDELISRITTDHNIQKTMEEPLSSDFVTTHADAGKLNNVIDDEVLKLAKNEIIRTLDLEEHEIKDEIISDLLENGRQSLSKYKEEFAPKVYRTAMNENDGPLMESLTKYFEQQWKIKYGSSNQWFILFLEEYKDVVNYDPVLKRTAEYGNKYMKDCPILSIVLQLLFEGIDNKFFDETNVFNDLWCAITDNGLKSIENFSDNKKRSVLLQALREYYRPKLFELLEKSKIPDEDNLYELTLENIAKYGWLQGLREVEERIRVKHFKILLENIPVSGDTSGKQVQLKVEAPTSVNEQTCMFGKDTQISWKFSGIGKLRVTWFLNDQLLPTDNRLQVTETDDGTSILTIRQVELGDQGVYITRVTNAFGEAEAQTTLKIDCIKPVINADLNSALEVTKGEIMALKIVASGTPKPDIVWMKDDNELTPNDRIQVATPNGNDDKYTMAILNAQPGDQEPPVFIVKLTTQKVKQGTTAVFLTKIDGYPTPTITWLLNGKPLVTKEGIQVQFDATTDEAKLSIPNIDLQQHAGSITCRLENPYGCQEETVQLAVLAAPIITTQLPKEQEIMSGEDVTLKVVVRGSPQPSAQCGWMSCGCEFDRSSLHPCPYSLSHYKKACI
ncbi:unnamed protein product [Rotaria sordida]|uniref:Ig-like domain-containing protein n=1 Tax=Rotaria sordida TaxID=392033 RepID=A0A819KXX8_9BILA|nr:unnamed protein product [Rotaria sordida]